MLDSSCKLVILYLEQEDLEWKMNTIREEIDEIEKDLPIWQVTTTQGLYKNALTLAEANDLYNLWWSQGHVVYRYMMPMVLEPSIPLSLAEAY